MVDTKSIADTVHRYLAAAATGSGTEIASLFADGATVEDPAGTEAHFGREAIAAFYDSVRGGERRMDLLTLKVAGNVAAFHFRVTTITEDATIIVEPIDVMTFDDQSRIKSMRAIWAPADIKTGAPLR